MSVNKKDRNILQEILDHLKDNTGELNVEEIKNAIVKAAGDEEKAKSVVQSLPDTYYSPSNKLANIMPTEGVILSTKEVTEILDLRVSGRNAKKEVTNACVIVYEGDERIQLRSRRPYMEYDREVHDAVVSLFAAGITRFTAATVYRVMTGSNDGDNISQQTLDRIEESLYKMRFINVKADVSSELEQRHIVLEDDSVIKGGRIDSYLLNLDRTEIEFENADGKGKVIGYTLNRAPILYAYSQLTKQLLSAPTKMLNITDGKGKPIRNSEQRIVIKGYLMRRILIMQGKTAQSNHILLKKIYDLFPTATDRKQIKRIRDYAIAVLDCWIKDGFIDGYEIVKKSGVDYAFAIKLKA